MLQEKVLQFISIYGYLGIFLALVFGILGLPIPDEILLTFAGFLISQGRMNYFGVIFISIIGSIVGVSMSFLIGDRLGMPFLKKYGRYVCITEESLNKAKVWYDKYGNYTILIGYFIPGIRQLNAYYAGICRKPYGQFAAYAYLGGTIWVMTFVTLGIYVNKSWPIWSHYFHKFTHMILVGSVICFSIYYVIKKIRKAS